MAQTEWERGTRRWARLRVLAARSRGVVATTVALGVALVACSSSDSVDESVLPRDDAPGIGLAVDARLVAPAPHLPTFDDANGFAGVPAGGRYQIGVRNAQSVVTATLAEDYPVEQVVTARFDTTGSPADVGFGVVCRKEDDDNYYRLGVGNDGTYAIQRVQDGDTTVLTGDGKWIGSPTIRETPGRFTVRAECVGETVTLYESNHKIASVRDTELQGGTVGVFVESFYKPRAAVQVDGLAVRARDRGRMTLADAQSWDAFVGAQRVSSRCTLLDRTRAEVHPDTRFVTRCGSVVFLQTDPPARGPRELDRILRETGTTPRTVATLPSCPKRTGIRGPLTRPTASGAADAPARIGEVACLDLGDSTAVVWVHAAAGVIGVERVKRGDRAAWKGYGPDWLPFALVRPTA